MTPTVLIYTSGGLIQDVRSSDHVNVIEIILDDDEINDTKKENPERISKALNGEDVIVVDWTDREALEHATKQEMAWALKEIET